MSGNLFYGIFFFIFFSLFLRLWPPRTFLVEFLQASVTSAAYAGKVVPSCQIYTEEVAQTQTLKAFFFQASHSVSRAAMAVFMTQMKGPNVQKYLKARHQLVDEALLLLVIPLMLPAVVGLMVNL